MQRSALKRQKNLYNEVSVLLDLTCHPNVKTVLYLIVGKVAISIKKNDIQLHY